MMAQMLLISIWHFRRELRWSIGIMVATSEIYQCHLIIKRSSLK